MGEEENRWFKLKMALLECYDIRGLLNLMEGTPEMKLMLRAVLNEMGDRERIECKRALQEAMLNLVRSSTRLQEMMAEIKGKCCNLEVYERIWREMVAVANMRDETMDFFETTDSPEEAEVYEEVAPCTEFLESVAWWRQDGLELGEDRQVYMKNIEMKLGSSEDRQVYRETSEDSEDRQVYRDTDWGDETVEMRKKRYQRMSARKKGINVPSQEDDEYNEWY